MHRKIRVLAPALLVAGLVAACAQPPQARVTHAANIIPSLKLKPGPSAAAAKAGIGKIRHVIIISQENRSFDSYFGTYPGADGLGPARKRACVPYPDEPCVKPFHTRHDVSAGGPHGHVPAVDDIDHGLMDGFIKEAARSQRQCQNPVLPQCGFDAPTQVMGYWTKREIPNYWAYAKHFVLQDHFFESTNNWSFPQHLYMVSGWAAHCDNVLATSCQATWNYQNENKHADQVILAWTDITYLLHAYGVSWRYFVQAGQQPDCTNPNAIVCPSEKQQAQKPGDWNPLPQFETVQEDNQIRDVQPVDNFFADVKRGGSLPAVSWIIPDLVDSEHPPSRVSDGQAWVTRIVDAVMRSPQWKHTAIFLSWDDWGGYYDNLKPPHIDHAGYGLRVPAITISPYAKRGYIDHQLLSSDAYLKFIEDRWLHGQRLDPRTDGRPDPRPDVREDKGRLGDLLSEFDFKTKKPQPKLVLPQRPHSDLYDPPGLPPPSQPCRRTCQRRLHN